MSRNQAYKVNLNDGTGVDINHPVVRTQYMRQGRPSVKLREVWISRFQEAYSKMTSKEKDVLDKLCGVNRQFMWGFGRGQRKRMQKATCEYMVSYINALHTEFPNRVPEITMEELLNPQAFKYEEEVSPD
tara:strand:+ start:4940 stop:5329 length:390 start_codon:yes stop_codon:yes gene_type:complete